MPTLRITNVGETEITLQDPAGISSFSRTIAKAATVDIDVSQDLMERLAPLLKKLEGEARDATSGKVISGARWSLLRGSAHDIRTLIEGVTGQPVLTELQAANYSTGTGAASVTVVGTALLGNQTKASKQILSGTPRLDLEAVVPGAPSNAYSFVLAVSGSSAIAVAVANSKITVTIKTAGETIADIRDAINSDASAKLLVKASEGVAGTATTAVAEKYLEGGKGPGVSAALNGQALSILEVSDTTLKVVFPTGISANGRIVPLDFKNGPHSSRISVPVVT
jgi:hypothetical protein